MSARSAQWDWKNYTVEDYAVGFVRLENGASIVIESSFAANIGKDEFKTTLLGTKGGACSSPLQDLRRAARRAHGHDSASGLASVNTYEAEVRAFYDALRDDTEVPVTGEQALNVIKILDAIYRSSDAGKEVTID